METENKEWKPDVGNTAWTISQSDLVQVELGERFLDSRNSRCFLLAKVRGRRFMGGAYVEEECLFPTAEAAFASIKVYDVEGNEVQSLAAEILGIKGKPTEQQRLDAMEVLDDFAVKLAIAKENEFNEQKQARKDRELIHRNLNQVISGEYDWVKIRQHDDLFKAVARLAGMEVGNG